MNEQLQKNLGNILELLQKAMMQTYDIGKQELPLFIKEYLAWTFYDNVIEGSVFLIAALVFASLIKWVFSKKEVSEEALICSVILGIPAVLICLFFTVMCYENAIKVTVAPRVVLMEQAKSLVSK